MISPKNTFSKDGKLFLFLQDSLDYLFEGILRLTYLLFITPYEVEYDTKKGSKVVRGSQWKKMTSLVLTLITTIVASISANSSFSMASIRSPAIIFKIAPDLGDIFLCFMFWYVIWARKNEIGHFLALMNLQTYELWRAKPAYIPSQKSLERFFPQSKMRLKEENKVKTSVKIFVSLICTFLAFIIVTFDLFKFHGRCRRPTMVNATIFECIFALDIIQGLFLSDQKPEAEEIDGFQTAVTAVFLAFEWYFMIFKAFAIILCLAGVAIIFKNSCDLAEFLNRETDQLKVIQAFEAFREFVESLNEITGPIMFGIAIVCAPTFYVANLSTIFITWTSESPITWLTVLLYGIILTLSAEVTNNTDEFREWILECGEGPYEEQLFANFVDLTQKPLGLRGMECFTVTHGFLAQVLKLNDISMTAYRKWTVNFSAYFGNGQ